MIHKSFSKRGTFQNLPVVVVVLSKWTTMHDIQKMMLGSMLLFALHYLSTDRSPLLVTMKMSSQ